MTDQPTDYSSIDAFHVGRRRKPNFTDHEVLLIIEQYDQYKELLHSREASKSVIAQKQAIWKRITDNLNTTYPQVERTVEDVRRKWKKLQSEAKREVTAYRAAQLAGSTTPVTNKQMNLYNRILSICRAPIPSSSSHFAHAVAVAAAMHRQQALQLQSNMNNENSNNHETTFNEQVSKTRLFFSRLCMVFVNDIVLHNRCETISHVLFCFINRKKKLRSFLFKNMNKLLY